MHLRVHQTTSSTCHITLLIRNLPPYARLEIGMHIAIDTAILQNDVFMLIASVPSIVMENLLLFARHVHLYRASRHNAQYCASRGDFKTHESL